MSRTKNSFLNIFSNSFSTVTSLLISFLSRYVFLKVLDATYLGVSGLFSNILLIFSFVELGIGAALTQLFYKPFEEKDYERLSIVTYTTKRLLHGVGIIIMLLTIMFTPFLEFFVNDINVVPNMRMIFFLYGISSASTYLAGYYRTIITANQEAYRLIKIDVLFNLLKFLLQSIVLVVTKNFVFYLIAQIIMSFSQNMATRYYVRKNYNFIDYNCKKFFSKNDTKILLKNVTALSMSRLSGVITNGTDNIIISKFLNITVVGVASNYTMLTQAVSSLVESIFGPLLSSIGNLCVTETVIRKREMFNNLSFLSFWIYGFCSITAFCLATPFIKLVFGSNLTIPDLALFFLCFDIFCTGITRPASLYRTAEGLFWEGKFRPLVQSLLNLIISLILVSQTNALWAVYAGTNISRLLVTVWYDPYIVMKYSVKEDFKKFYLKELLEFIVYFLALILMIFIKSMVSLNGFLEIVVLGILCVCIINAIFVLFYFKTSEFIYWIKFGLNTFQKIKYKNKI